MSKKFINKVSLQGLIYEHDLKEKVTGDASKTPGMHYISGTLDIATDNDLTNVVSVHYAYVPQSRDGQPNANYTTLSSILSGKIGSVMANGKDNAGKVRIDSSIALNDFYTNRGGAETLVSAKRNEGGFIHLADNVTDGRSDFECDMVITQTRRLEADPDKNIKEKLIVKGAIFDFKKSLLPVEFSAVSPNAISYFEGLDASSKNPVFTKVWGKEINETVVRTIEEESAFGDSSVREVKSSRKDFVITGAAKEVYPFGDEEFLTRKELDEASKNRELYLATLRQRKEELKSPAPAEFKF